MQKYKVAAIMLLIGTVAGAALFPEAYAQETPDLEFEFSQSQIIIFIFMLTKETRMFTADMIMKITNKRISLVLGMALLGLELI